MLNKLTEVTYAQSIAEVQTTLKNVTGITLAAGCTEIARRQTGRNLHLPSEVLALGRIPELCSICKTERYVEFGAAVTLDAILQLGRKNVPDVLYDAIKGIANPGIRALATIGGNISAKGQRLSAFAPLLALDARLEIRTPGEASWIPMSRYFSNEGREASREPDFISKIRIPTELWDVSIYQRLGAEGIVTTGTASFAFLAKFQKNILADLRIAFAGKFFFRKKEFENLLIGRSLPLSMRDIMIVKEKAELFFEESYFPPSLERSCIFNLLEEGLKTLT